MLNNTVQQINISPYHFAPDKTGDAILAECNVLRSMHGMKAYHFAPDKAGRQYSQSTMCCEAYTTQRKI